jgi:F420H(2)-dependent quinone reductase
MARPDMALANAMVSWILRSPAHRVLSGSTDLVRYTGRKTGRTITTPTQYAADGDHLVILVGRPSTKTWWHNFATEEPVDVLVAGRWQSMIGVAHVGADQPATVGPLVDAYLERHPKADRALDGATRDEKIRSAVVVDCWPR